MDEALPTPSDPILGRSRTTPAEELAAQLERTVDRLRGMGIARLGASFEPEPSRAAAAHATAQRLEDSAAALEGRPARALPRLADAAAGDQLAVVGHDLLAAAHGAGPQADHALVDAASWLLDLRRRV